MNELWLWLIYEHSIIIRLQFQHSKWGKKTNTNTKTCTRANRRGIFQETLYMKTCLETERTVRTEYAGQAERVACVRLQRLQRSVSRFTASQCCYACAAAIVVSFVAS